MVTFEQFKALEIRIAKILSCEVHPNADKLYVVTLEVGDKQKKVVAGIKNYYTPEELIGKSVVLLDNLETATIRGVQSEGMILATREGEKLAVLTPDREIASGSLVS
jgi:methionine--tRNA ligase beta chain